MAGTSVSMVVLELGTIWPMRNVWVMTCLCRVLRVSDQNQLSVYALFLQKICRLANDVLLGVCTYLVRKLHQKWGISIYSAATWCMRNFKKLSAYT
jgi:hypothetical protein